MPSTPLLHIGYHKTATTWMQRQLFMPVHGYRQLCGHEDVFRHIVQPHGLRFDPAPMQSLITEANQKVEQGEVGVVSSEILSGHPFLGGRESEVYAERLAKIFPKAKVLISIRNQMQILPSVYMQYVLRGGTMPVDRFFQGTNEIGYFGFSAENFEYDRLVSLYERLFGSSNVYILPQESLRRNMNDAMLGLARFSGNKRYVELTDSAKKPVAQSYPEYTAPVLRRINHVQSSTLNPWPIISFGSTPKGLYKFAGYVMKKPPISTFLQGRKPVSDYVKQRFGGYYAESNRRLAALSTDALDLSGYDGVLPTELQ
jgi:hypothetical protein